MPSDLRVEGCRIISRDSTRLITVTFGPHDRENMLVVVCLDGKKVGFETTFRQTDFGGIEQKHSDFFWPIDRAFSVPEYMLDNEYTAKFKAMGKFDSFHQQEKFISFLTEGLGRMRSTLFFEAEEGQLREVRLSAELKAKLASGEFVA